MNWWDYLAVICIAALFAPVVFGAAVVVCAAAVLPIAWLTSRVKHEIDRRLNEFFEE